MPADYYASLRWSLFRVINQAPSFILLEVVLGEKFSYYLTKCRFARVVDFLGVMMNFSDKLGVLID